MGNLINTHSKVCTGYFTLFFNGLYAPVVVWYKQENMPIVCMVLIFTLNSINLTHQTKSESKLHIYLTHILSLKLFVNPIPRNNFFCKNMIDLKISDFFSYTYTHPIRLIKYIFDYSSVDNNLKMTEMGKNG